MATGQVDGRLARLAWRGSGGTRVWHTPPRGTNKSSMAQPKETSESGMIPSWQDSLPFDNVAPRDLCTSRRAKVTTSTLSHLAIPPFARFCPCSMSGVRTKLAAGLIPALSVCFHPRPSRHRHSAGTAVKSGLNRASCEYQGNGGPYGSEATSLVILHSLDLLV